MKYILFTSIIVFSFGLISSLDSDTVNSDKTFNKGIAHINEDTTKRKQLFSEEAFVLIKMADSLQSTRGFDFMQCLDLLNKADSIEPNNPTTLEKRGNIKFNFHYELESAFDDFEKAIFYAYDQPMKERMSFNLGLSYMEICDIKSACDNWNNAGQHGEGYIKKYCSICNDSLFENNLNDDLKLELKIESKNVKILSTHNSPKMSNCKAVLVISNINHKTIIIKKSFLELNLASENTNLFLEAKDADGNKINFISPNKVKTYETKKDFKLTKGNSFEAKLNLTQIHHFFKPGLYQVRVCLRPAENTSGLKNNYYSNWTEIEVSR